MYTAQKIAQIGQANFGSARGWQKRLAEALGVASPIVSMMVNGRYAPNAEVCSKLRVLENNAENGVTLASVVADVPVMAEPSFPVAVPVLSDAEVEEKIRDTFSFLESMLDIVIDGTLPAVIISGPGGFGKSYTAIQKLKVVEREGRAVVKLSGGKVTAVGLYQSLYKVKNNGILLLDDCDIWDDENAIQIMKAALDTSEERYISWASKASWVQDCEFEDELEAGMFPSTFVFEGSVIFLSNVDFDAKIDAGTKMAPHYEALRTRCPYLNIGLKSTHEKIIRMRQGAREFGILEANHLTTEQGNEILEFIEENAMRFQVISFRLLINAAKLYKLGNWKRAVELTMMKR